MRGPVDAGAHSGQGASGPDNRQRLIDDKFRMNVSGGDARQSRADGPADESRVQDYAR